jgi:thiol-disulfide isomerase/thioredoxin
MTRRLGGIWAVMVWLAGAGVVRSDEPKPVEPTAPAKQEATAEQAADRYAVPEGDAAALLKFIESLQTFQPKTREELFAHRRQAPGAIKSAAEKILKVEQDASTPAHKKASEILFQHRLQSILAASPEEQRKIVDELKTFLSNKQPSEEDMQLALATASPLEHTGKTELAGELYGLFGESLSRSADKRLGQYGQLLKGCATRLGLVGKPLELKGKKMDGSEFDVASLKGQVVLVDFWATWCGPCLAELPNLKKQYARYHGKGFEVVSISVDRDRAALEKFLEKENPEWVTLHSNSAPELDPLSIQFGVLSIPTMMLVDKEGKVVTLSARGEQLNQQLEKLLGPAESAADTAAVPAAP